MVLLVVVPFGLLAAALAPAVLEESRDERAPPLDVAGAALGAAAFALLALGLARVEESGLGAGPIVAAALGLLAAFVALERRVRAPILRLAILRHRPLTGANLSIAANAGGFVGMTFLATLYMQQVLGYSPLEAGLAFVPLALSACAGGLLAPRIVERAGPRRTAAVSLVVTAAAFVFLDRLPDRDGYVPVLLRAFLLATAAAARTNAALDGGEPAAAALTSGFGLAFLVAAGIVALGALSAVRTLPGRT